MLGDRLRSFARGARQMPDRILHSVRRGAATRLLARQPLPRSVLFVCHGNICRSPYAAAVARRLFPTAVAVESAGFIGPGRPSPPEAVAVAAERGMDLSPHRSQLVTAEHLSRADTIVVMDPEQRRQVIAMRAALPDRVVLLGDLDPEPIKTRSVSDPVDQPIDAFRSSYGRIERCIRVFAALWREGSPGEAQS
jgi:protein-tyrosine-phosphatase